MTYSPQMTDPPFSDMYMAKVRLACASRSGMAAPEVSVRIALAAFSPCTSNIARAIHAVLCQAVRR